MRLLSRWFLRILYPGLAVEGQEYVEQPGPFMLAGNHPNTLIDPLIQGIFLSRRLYFMANAGMFKNPLAAKFLDFAGVIPIVRRGIDKNDKVDNQQSFRAAYRHFENGGIMFVAPEGGSELERRLRRPLKLGTAKMAFTVEEANDWSLGLRIVPAGGNYEAPTRCFSRAFVRFGPPILVADYRELYAKSPRQALVQLTRDLGERMARLLIDTQDKAEEHLLRPIDRALQNDRPLRVDRHHYRVRELLEQLRALPEAEREQLAEQAGRYETLLRQHRVNDLALSSHPAKRGPLGLWLGLPLFVWGALNHLPLLAVVEWVRRTVGAENNYTATVRGLVGSLALPVLYILQSLLFGLLFPGGWAWGYLLTLPVFGLFALAYHTSYRAYWITVLQRGRVTEEMRSLRRALRAVGP